MEKLFTYGTLQDSKIQQKLFGRILAGEEGTLANYVLSTIRIDGEEYPIAVFESDTQISGIAYDLSPTELKLADEYEGTNYKRIKTKLLSNVEAWVYVRA